jgi:hypothetical protein
MAITLIDFRLRTIIKSTDKTKASIETSWLQPIWPMKRDDAAKILAHALLKFQSEDKKLPKLLPAASCRARKSSIWKIRHHFKPQFRYVGLHSFKRRHDIRFMPKVNRKLHLWPFSKGRNPNSQLHLRVIVLGHVWHTTPRQRLLAHDMVFVSSPCHNKSLRLAPLYRMFPILRL